MKNVEMRTRGAGLILDRAGKFSALRWAMLFNDHANRLAVEATERTVRYTGAQISSSLGVSEWAFALGTTVLRVLEATLETASGNIDNTPLRIVTVEEIRQARRISTTSGVPRLIGFELLTGGTMRALVHPPASQQRYVAVRALVFPTDFTYSGAAVDAETFDFPDEVDHLVVREAAIDAALIMGSRRAVIDSIMTRAQQLQQDQQGRLGDYFAPRTPTDEPL